jgi:hypothetical protein
VVSRRQAPGVQLRKRVTGVPLRTHGRASYRKEVTARDLRAIPLAQFLAQAQAAAQRMVDAAEPLGGDAEDAAARADLAGLPSWWVEAGQRRAEAAEELRLLADRRRRREHLSGSARGRGEEFYRWVALVYLDEVRGGNRRRLHEAIAERAVKERGEQDVVKRETVRDWIRRARKLEFLGEGEQGRVTAREGRLLRAPLDADQVPQTWKDRP